MPAESVRSAAGEGKSGRCSWSVSYRSVDGRRRPGSPGRCECDRERVAATRARTAGPPVLAAVEGTRGLFIRWSPQRRERGRASPAQPLDLLGSPTWTRTRDLRINSTVKQSTIRAKAEDPQRVFSPPADRTSRTEPIPNPLRLAQTHLRENLIAFNGLRQAAPNRSRTERRLKPNRAPELEARQPLAVRDGRGSDRAARGADRAGEGRGPGILEPVDLAKLRPSGTPVLQILRFPDRQAARGPAPDAVVRAVRRLSISQNGQERLVARRDDLLRRSGRPAKSKPRRSGACRQALPITACACAWRLDRRDRD